MASDTVRDIVMNSVQSALYASVGVTLVALVLFGFVKGRVTGINALRSGLQTMLIGGWRRVQRLPSPA